MLAEVVLAAAVFSLTVVGLSWLLGLSMRPALSPRRDNKPLDRDNADMTFRADTASLRPPADDPKVITTRLENAGLGPAIVRNVRYELRTTSGQTYDGPAIREVVDFLRDRCGAVDDVDYFLFGISPTWALASHTTAHIATLTLPLAHQLTTFRVTLTCRSPLVRWPRLTRRLDLVPSGPGDRELSPTTPDVADA